MAYDQGILSQLQQAGRFGTVKQDGKIYQGMWSGSGGGGEDSQGSDYLTGYYTYDDYTGADGNGKPVYGQTPYQGFDMSGNQTTSGVMKKDNPTQMLLMALAAAGGMAYGLPAMMGGQGAMGAGAGLAGDAFLPGALGAEGAGAAAVPGLESYFTGTLAGDAFMPGALAGDAMMPGYLNLGGAMPTGMASIPGLDAYAVSGAAGGAGGAEGGLMGTVDQVANNPMVRGASLGATTASLLGGKQGGGISGQNLADIIAGVMDYRGNKGASQDMLNYMREQQGKIDNMFQPGSPEWESLWESMSRRDAAAGRNSQYGPRTVDFMGRVADTKAKYTAALTDSLAKHYGNAFDQENLGTASAGGGIARALLDNPQNLSSIIDFVTSNFGGRGTPGKSSSSGEGGSLTDYISSLFN